MDERLDCSPVVDLAGSRPGCGASGLRLENICIVLIPPGLPFCKADLVPRLQRIWNSEKPDSSVARMPIFLDEQQVREQLRMSDLIPAMKQALIDFSAGKV